MEVKKMAEVRMRFKDGLCKAFTMSYDDGVVQDVRLIKIMRENGLKGTFNLNTGRYHTEGIDRWDEGVSKKLTLDEAKNLYIQNGMEVATHGVNHPFFTKLSPEGVIREIFDDRRALENQYGVIVRGHAYPFGAYNEKVIDLMRSCGIIYARTVDATRRFDVPEDFMKLDPTCHHDDEKLFELAEKFTTMQNLFGYPMLFYLWGHAYEFDINNNWERIEKFCKTISGKSDVWYATNIEIVEYVNAYRALVFDIDMTKVYNGSAKAVWFEYDGKTYKVCPDETILLN